MKFFQLALPGLLCGLLMMAFHPQPAFSQTLRQVTPDQVEALVSGNDNGKLLVIHYTSDDGSCSYCMDNNKAYEKAAAGLSEDYDFIAVTLNPWRSFFDDPAAAGLLDFQKEAGFPLVAVPAIMIFDGGKPVRMMPGKQNKLVAVLSQVYETVRNEAARVRGPIIVAQIPPTQSQAYIRALSAKRPLVVTLSSIDEDCPSCITGNAAVDEASRYLAEDFHFARVDYNPWRSIGQDEAMKKFLKKHKVKISGLPTSLVFYRGKLKGSVVTNGQDLRTALSQALPAIKGKK